MAPTLDCPAASIIRVQQAAGSSNDELFVTFDGQSGHPLQAEDVIVIGRAGVGVDNVDHAYARTRGIAVANVPRIFNELKETQDLEERFKQDRARLAGEEKPMVQQLEELQAEGRNYRQGSPQFEEWRVKFVKARVNHKAWAEVAKAEIEWKRKRQTREMYDKIYAAVSEYATSNQIDLVLAETQAAVPAPMERARQAAIDAMEGKAPKGRKGKAAPAPVEPSRFVRELPAALYEKWVIG